MRSGAGEARIAEIGRALLARPRGARGALGRGLAPLSLDALIEWSLERPRLRAQLFRFVDVLPALDSAEDVVSHLRSYLLREAGGELPAALARALAGAPVRGPAAAALAAAARRGVRRLGRRFIAGATQEEVLATAARLARRGWRVTIDILGESVASEAEADAYRDRYLALLERRRGIAVSLKLSALHSDFDPLARGRVTAAVLGRLRPILRLARERGARVTIDMEQRDTKDLTLEIFRAALAEPEFRDFPGAGVVLQAYLPETERDLRELETWARARGQAVAVRLVKGAYWDLERALAAQRGWPDPVFTEKWRTDAAYEHLAEVLLDAHPQLRPAFGSHNVRSVAAALEAAERRGVAWSELEVQVLYGMGEWLAARAHALGVPVRVYAPFGPLLPGMSYLIRRLLENTSNQSFLRRSVAERAPEAALLAPPGAAGGRSAPPPVPASRAGERAAFRNEPPTDFSLGPSRAGLDGALERVRSGLGVEVGAWIGERTLPPEPALLSLDPSSPGTVVARARRSSRADADEAVAIARRGFLGWRDRPAAARARILRCAAAEIRRRRFELAAWLVLEVGKPWREADGEVAEAIDFCELYASAAEDLEARPRRRDVLGEENVCSVEPRGVAAVIAPWNFPLSIAAGMAAAALAVGNAVVLKPAEQAPAVASRLVGLLRGAGVPPEAVQLLPGVGEEVGAHLVEHAGVDVIAFTGSRAVGLDILGRAARPAPGQRGLKRVIAELGGKNAIVVDADADLDEAVRGVRSSAFGYAGQKCSACSRVIVHEAVAERFLARLADATRCLRVGPAADPDTEVGPVIDAEARARILGWIGRGAAAGRVVARAEAPGGDGYYVAPVLIDDVPPSAAIAREEVFGPVLVALRARSFEEALAIANESEYGLTGGVYSRDPSHVELARREFRVGNLYVNRPITGALVDRHPFGGLKQSGTGGKTGWEGALLEYAELRTLSECTIRHGFAPEEIS